MHDGRSGLDATSPQTEASGSIWLLARNLDILVRADGIPIEVVS